MTLIYTETADYSHFTNVLLINDEVNAYMDLVNAVNSSTFPIVYSSNSSKTELLSLLSQHFTTISRIAILFNFPGGDIPPLFLDNEPLFTGNNLEGNARFIMDLINTFQIKNMDFITCYALNYSTYVSYFDTLTSSTGVIVGSSNDKTGSTQCGGNWIMENTNEDIGNVYFTNSVESYPYLLDLVEFTIIITTDGKIYGCGLNASGQLGNGNTTNTNSLVQMINTTGKKPYKVSIGGSHTIVLMTDQSVYGCGSNVDGQLGLGNTTSPILGLTLITMPTDEKPSNVFAGSGHTIILMDSGNVYVCGSNASGQFGNGNTTSSNSLVQMQMPSNLNGMPYFFSNSGSTSILLTTTGYVYSCGDTTGGQLGRSTGSALALLPVPIPNNEIASSIATGSNHTIVLMQSGNVYGAGYNNYGQLGNANAAYSGGSESLIQMENTTGKTPSSIYCGLYGTTVLMSDNTIYSCGDNNNGVFGNGFLVIQNKTLQQMTIPNGRTPSKILKILQSNLVLMTDGTIFGAGSNFNGQLGFSPNGNFITSLTAMTLTSGGSSIGTVLGFANTIVSYFIICFKEDTEIYTMDGYKPIQQLKKGDLIQTSQHGYKPIYKIGKKQIYHPAEKKRIKDQLYKCTPDNYPELIDDLIITGCHSILVNDFTTYEQKEKTIKLNGDLYITEKKYRLPVCLDERAYVYEKPGNYTIYHFALENDDYYKNYGIYANGLLVESCSKKNMTFM